MLPFEIRICVAQPTCIRWFGIRVETQPGLRLRVNADGLNAQAGESLNSPKGKCAAQAGEALKV
jgi:hypothetical protein